MTVIYVPIDKSLIDNNKNVASPNLKMDKKLKRPVVSYKGNTYKYTLEFDQVLLPKEL